MQRDERLIGGQRQRPSHRLTLERPPDMRLQLRREHVHLAHAASLVAARCRKIPSDSLLRCPCSATTILSLQSYEAPPCRTVTVPFISSHSFSFIPIFPEFTLFFLC